MCLCASQGLVCGGGAHLAWQVRTVDLGSRADCLHKFQSNHYFGLALFGAIVAGRLLLEAADEGSEGEQGGRPPPQPRTISLLLDAVRGS